MATVTKTWTFDTDLEGWESQNPGSIQPVWYGADGDPGAGCIRWAYEPDLPQEVSLALNATWEALGVPAGATVTNVSATLRRKIVSTDAPLQVNFQFWCIDPEWYPDVFLLDETTGTPHDWADMGGATSSAVPAPQGVSSQSMYYFWSLATSAASDFDLRLDSLALTITYTGGATPPPPPAAKPHPRLTVVAAENRRTVVPGTDVLEDAGRRTEVTE